MKNVKAWWAAVPTVVRWGFALWLGVGLMASGAAVWVGKGGALLFPVFFAMTSLLVVAIVAIPLGRVYRTCDTLYALAEDGAAAGLWSVKAETVALVVEGAFPRHSAAAREARWARYRRQEQEEAGSDE